MLTSMMQLEPTVAAAVEHAATAAAAGQAAEETLACMTAAATTADNNRAAVISTWVAQHLAPIHRRQQQQALLQWHGQQQLRWAVPCSMLTTAPLLRIAWTFFAWEVSSATLASAGQAAVRVAHIAAQEGSLLTVTVSEAPAVEFVKAATAAAKQQAGVACPSAAVGCLTEFLLGGVGTCMLVANQQMLCSMTLQS
jgi:hypothetical protein